MILNTLQVINNTPVVQTGFTFILHFFIAIFIFSIHFRVLDIVQEGSCGVQNVKSISAKFRVLVIFRPGKRTVT